MNKYIKINKILSFSDVHPEDHRFILSYILELQKENEKLNHYKLLYQKVKDRNDKAIEFIEEHSNSESEYLDVFEVKELLEILKGNNEE